MKFRWYVVALAGLSVIAVDPALARAKKHKVVRSHCIDRPVHFSWDNALHDLIVPTDRAPQPNGCSPAVYNYGQYVGQDPDRNIRFQLNRDPATGYSPFVND